MTGGIYQIRHIASGRIYVGQAVNFERRWKGHRDAFAAGRHHATHLSAAWRKYGSGAFAFEPLLICAPSDLTMYEQAAIDALTPEFNMAKIARTRRGVPQSDEAKAKIGAAHRGMKRSAAFCAATAARVSGTTHTDEAKAKMRAAKLGKKMSPDTLANMAAAQAARVRPAEEYESRRGRTRDPEMIERGAVKRRGVKRTPEQVARMKEAAARMSPEVRFKIAEARRAAHARRQAERA